MAVKTVKEIIDAYELLRKEAMDIYQGMLQAERDLGRGSAFFILQNAYTAKQNELNALLGKQYEEYVGPVE